MGNGLKIYCLRGQRCACQLVLNKSRYFTFIIANIFARKLNYIKTRLFEYLFKCNSESLTTVSYAKHIII